MNRPSLRLLLAGSLSICVFAASAQEREESVGRYYFAPAGSIAISQKSDTHDVAVGGALAIGASWVPHIGIEIVGDYLRYTHIEHTYGAGLGMNAYLASDNQGFFIHGDVEGGNRSAYNAGLGFDRPILGRRVSLRLQALWHKEGDTDPEAMFRFGLRIPFGGKPQLEPVTPETVAVVPVDQPDSPLESDARPEVSGAFGEAVPPEQSSSVEPPDADDVVVGSAPAVPLPSSTEKKTTPQQPHKNMAVPEKARISEPPAAAEPASTTDTPANTEAADDGSSAGSAVSAPPEPSPDEELAPTEPAPAPKQASAQSTVEADTDIAPDVSIKQDSSAESDDAPTEPAPKPPR